MSPEHAHLFALAYGVALFLFVNLTGIFFLLLRISRSKKNRRDGGFD